MRTFPETYYLYIISSWCTVAYGINDYARRLLVRPGAYTYYMAEFSKSQRELILKRVTIFMVSVWRT